MAGYSREFLIDAFVSRYEILSAEAVARQRQIAEKTYDEFGKDKFRVYASLDADAIKEFKLKTGRKG